MKKDINREFIIADSPDREELFAEIWVDRELLAEVYIDDESRKPLFRVFAPRDVDWWDMDYRWFREMVRKMDDFLESIGHAGQDDAARS